MKRSIRWLCGLALAASGLATTPAQAEQRALLVGVGQYQTPGIDLPGIDLDLERVHDTLIRMGFKDSQIRTLRDSEATSTAVIRSFETWLKEGVQPQDRVVFYFSGHGSNIPDFDGDESDGVDEVLVTNDMKRARVKGRASLVGVLVDDKLAQLIAAIPSRNVWIVVDSCHSGTITRTIDMKNRSLARDAVYVKSFSYPGMPVSAAKSTRSPFATRGIKAPAAAVKENFVSLTAAGDAEEAIGTSRGGVFTIGLTEAFARLAAQGKTPTVAALKDEAAAYIRSKVDRGQVHTPQITGNVELARGALRLIEDAPAPTAGPNRQRLLDLVKLQGGSLKLTATATKYSVDQPVQIGVDVPFAGYLNVVTVDADDVATVIYPNRHQAQNLVQPGTLRIPSEAMDFELLAAEPLGPTLVVAFLTSAPLNFFNETLDQRDSQGRINVDFPELSHTATRAIRVAPREARSFGGQLEIEVVR
jgi:metacaspase-1